MSESTLSATLQVAADVDILELLRRNPGLDMARLRALCAGYRLEADLDGVLALAQSP